MFLRQSVIVVAAALPGGDGAPEWLTYATAGVALLSLLAAVLFGLSTRRTARKALAISERQEARRLSRLDLYVNESAAWSQAGERILGVNLLVANPTDRESTVISAEIHLTYAVEGRLTTVKIPSLPAAPDTLAAAGIEHRTLPLRLAANHAEAGWFLFRLREDLTAGRAVDRYDIAVRDLHGIEQSLQITIFGERTT